LEAGLLGSGFTDAVQAFVPFVGVFDSIHGLGAQ
jgi:hypothetical protein